MEQTNDVTGAKLASPRAMVAPSGLGLEVPSTSNIAPLFNGRMAVSKTADGGPTPPGAASRKETTS